jgi:hypothetical protein
MAVSRADWLLLFLSPDALGLNGEKSIDPVRIQKAIFLLSMRGPKRDLYQFEAYNWGPFSRDIYADLHSLVEHGLAVSEPVPGRSWFVYKASKQGEKRAAEVAEELGPGTVGWLAQARQFVVSRSFVRLLKQIYEMYPTYAAKSKLAVS